MYYFHSAYLAPVMRTDSLLRLWLYINLLLTYLLTNLLKINKSNAVSASQQKSSE